MKNGLLFLSALLVATPIAVKAEENVNLNVTTEFTDSVVLEKIDSIYIQLDDVNGSNHVVTVYKEDDFKTTVENFPNGEIQIMAYSVELDYVNRFPIEYRIEYADDAITINLVVDQRELKSDDEDQRIKLDESYYEKIYGKYYQEAKDKYENSHSTTTVVVTNEAGERITAELTPEAQKEYEEYLKREEERKEKEKQEKEQQEKEKKEEKERTNRILKWFLIGLGVVVFAGLVFVAIKVAGANK